MGETRGQLCFVAPQNKRKNVKMGQLLFSSRTRLVIRVLYVHLAKLSGGHKIMNRGNENGSLMTRRKNIPLLSSQEKCEKENETRNERVGDS